MRPRSSDVRYSLTRWGQAEVERNIHLIKWGLRMCGPSRRIDYDEQWELASLALIDAVVHHNPRRGKLSGYYLHALRRRIRDAENEGGIIHLPRNGYLCPREDLREARMRAARVSPIPVDRSPEAPLARPDRTEELIDRQRQSELAWDAIRSLPPRVRTVMGMRARGVSFEAIGSQLGYCKEYIRQLESKGIELVRADIRAKSRHAVNVGVSA